MPSAKGFSARLLFAVASAAPLTAGVQAPAAASQVPEIVVGGVKLGGPFAGVAATLQKRKLLVDSLVSRFLDDGPSPLDRTVLIVGDAAAHDAAGALAGEGISVWSTLAPATPTVARVVRGVIFPTDQRPPVANVFSTMRTMFGAPTDSVGTPSSTTVDWVFDVDGNRMTKWPANGNQQGQRCLAQVPAPVSEPRWPAGNHDLRSVGDWLYGLMLSQTTPSILHQPCSEVGTLVSVTVDVAEPGAPLARKMSVSAARLVPEFESILAAIELRARRKEVMDSIALVKARGRTAPPE